MDSYRAGNYFGSDHFYSFRIIAADFHQKYFSVKYAPYLVRRDQPHPRSLKMVSLLFDPAFRHHFYFFSVGQLAGEHILHHRHIRRIFNTGLYRVAVNESDEANYSKFMELFIAAGLCKPVPAQ